MWRRILLVMLLLLLVILVFGCRGAEIGKTEALSVEEKLVGEWGNEDMSFVFNKDGTLAIVVDNFVIGTENQREVLWVVEETDNLVYLDIIMRKNETGEELITPAILRFITDTKIQVVATDDSQRPVSFFSSAEEDSFVLNRK